MFHLITIITKHDVRLFFETKERVDKMYRQPSITTFEATCSQQDKTSAGFHSGITLLSTGSLR